MDSETLYKRYVQDEIMEWQIFNNDYVDTYKLACKAISIMNEKPNIEPYELGFSTISLLMGFYPCKKIFAFEEKDYYDFGKALLNARDWAKEDEEADEISDDEENAADTRTISLVGKTEKDLKHFTKEDVMNMWKALFSRPSKNTITKGQFTKSILIKEIFASKASKITFNSKFHRDIDLSEMEPSDLLFVLSHDQLIAAAEVVLDKKDYIGKSDEEIAKTIKDKTKSHLIGI
jgi:hypothetical protein